MTIALEDSTLQDVKDAVRKSLGLRDDESFQGKTSLKNLNPTVEPTDLLEIFKAVGITPTELKPYMVDRGLTEKGRVFLTQQVTKELKSKPSFRLYKLAETNSLDEFTQKINSKDIYNIATYKSRQ